MKIGVDIRCLQAGRRSGVEEYTIELLKHLLRTDHQNEYVFFLNSYRDPQCDLSWVNEFKNARIKRYRIPNKLLNFCLWYFRSPKLDLLLGGTDIFFAPNMNFLALSPKTKLVLTVHDLSFDFFSETFSWKRRLWHFFVNPRSLCRIASSIIAVSQATAEDLKDRWMIPEKKIQTIYSGLRADYRPMGRNDPKLLKVKEKYNLPYRFILFLGTLEPRKNVISLVRAYEIFRLKARGKSSQHKLVIAGSDGWKSGNIFNVIQSSTFRNDIFHIGPVEEEEKRAFYSLAALFVYPSFYEGFGFPILESMGCGTPVIASNTSSLPEIAGHGAMLVNPVKPREIATAIEELIEDATMSDMFRDMGAKNVRRFLWNKTADETLRVFRELER